MPRTKKTPIQAALPAIPLDTPLPPKLPSERPEEYLLFLSWIFMPDRSSTKMALRPLYIDPSQTAPSVSTCEKTCAKNKWKARAEEFDPIYDQWLARHVAAKRLETTLSAVDRHITIYQQMQAAGMAELLVLQQRQAKRKREGGDQLFMKASEIVNTIMTGVEGERRAMGLDNKTGGGAQGTIEKLRQQAAGPQADTDIKAELAQADRATLMLILSEAQKLLGLDLDDEAA